ncbi:hypothetical protein HD806DRAFT_255397 [Xylariaceae sp. AK1471]|nr:hypothetical protein HD806DRAFT_255397 [Xylariaceae sp. AK1471]
MPRKKNNPKAKAKAKGAPPPHLRQRFDTTNNRNSSPFARSHGYTLAEEARNTASNRRGNRGRDARLRYQPVTFISAGFMDPLKLFEVPEQTAPSMQAKAAVPCPHVDDDLVPSPLSTRESRTQSPGVKQTAWQEPVHPRDEHADVESDPGSDSSEEVILFKGRNAGRRQQKSPSPRPDNDRNDSSNTNGPREINLALRIVKETVHVAVDADSVSQAEEPDFISFSENRGNRRGRSSSRRPRFNGNSNDDDDEEAAIIADYIANMQNDSDNDDDEVEEGNRHMGLGSHGFSILRDLGGTDSDAIPTQPSSGDESFNELYDEADEEDAEEQDEERQLQSADERLARLIAKQEELGLDADDVLLFDGLDPDDGWLPAPMSMPRRKKKGASKKSKMSQRGSQFPSATRMAEAFDAMDLMDMQCSRLQSSKKGPVSFGLSDSELEDALNVAIQKDRLKKADKKKAREELRSQGLLGKNVNPSDLRVKYRGGMSLDDLADEFEAFMLSTREQCVSIEMNYLIAG